VFLGDAILMVLSAAGVASLLKASPGLFHVVKYVGAAYLAWIGFQMLRGACATGRRKPMSPRRRRRRWIARRTRSARRWSSAC
jgi:threonine/homoserine/homoserine lactone efflux protein